MPQRQFETLTLGFLEELYVKAYFGRYVTEMEGWVSKGGGVGEKTVGMRH